MISMIFQKILQIEIWVGGVYSTLINAYNWGPKTYDLRDVYDHAKIVTSREEQGGKNLNEDLVLLFQEIERQGNARENTHGEDPSYEDCNVMQKRFTYLLYSDSYHCDDIHIFLSL